MKLSPEEARAALVKALRSGDYEQCTLTMHKGDRFCCLGVACDLYKRIEGEGDWITEDGGYSFMERNAFLPEKVQEWLGFKTNQGHLVTCHSLSSYNDNGDDFPCIAQRIEDGEVKLA